MAQTKRFALPLLVLATFGLAFLLVVALAPTQAYAGDADGSTALAAGSAADADSSASVAKTYHPTVSYKAVVSGKWTSGWKKQGKVLGSAGKELQVLRVKVAKDGLSGSIKYRVYSRNKGWRAWVSNGKPVGEKGWKTRGVQMKLTGALAKKFDVVYRVYLKGAGWMPWVVNGATSGSTGKLAEIAKIQVKLVEKGSAASVADGAYCISMAKNTGKTLQLAKGTTKAGAQVSKAAFSSVSLNERFFVRNEGGGAISIQSCASGLFLCESGGKVVQRADAASSEYRWKLSTWKGGYQLVNVATGHKVALSGSKAVAGSKGARWMLTAADIVPESTFSIVQASAGTALAVEDYSVKNGANMWVETPLGINCEVFTFKRAAKNTYYLTNAASGKRVEVKDGSTSEGAAVQQNKAKSAALQRWKVTLERDGRYTFTNKASGKVLTATGSGADESLVKSKADAAAKTQRWKLKAAKVKSGADGWAGDGADSSSLAVARASSLANSAYSATSYVITVDLTHHWLCIFKGSQGNRDLYKSWICSTGAPGSTTPTGDYTINGNHQYEFGSTYSCYYATGFIGWVYLFHSIKYDKDTFNVQDGRLGQSVSEGCVRLSLENARWLYNNIPTGTKVKIYW